MKKKSRIDIYISDVDKLKKRLEILVNQFKDKKKINQYVNSRVLLEKELNKALKSVVKLCSSSKSEINKQLLNSLILISKEYRKLSCFLDVFINNYFLSDKSREEMINILGGFSRNAD